MCWNVSVQIRGPHSERGSTRGRQEQEGEFPSLAGSQWWTYKLTHLLTHMLTQNYNIGPQRSTYTYKQGYPKHFEKAHRADIIREKSVNCEFYVVANFEFRSFSLLPHASCHHAMIQEVISTWWSCWLTTGLISTVKTTGRSRASWPHLERLIFPLTSLSIQDLFLLLRCSFFHLFFLVLHLYNVTLVSPITGSFQGGQVPGRPRQPVPVRCRPQEIRVHPLWQGVWDLYLYVCVCVCVCDINTLDFIKGLMRDGSLLGRWESNLRSFRSATRMKSISLYWNSQVLHKCWVGISVLAGEP